MFSNKSWNTNKADKDKHEKIMKKINKRVMK